ncbi:N-alpha-acetyltransferase 80-like [Culex quinquefasciatus]|uniref:N-alpha-acetyltransferase 80-like n=1 Tax=Culex quinquefasciatus TaxID=7176 RepID=UPI0018E2A6F0|nr:N-alpha-acetyltransferase 80-like [Culex quinquefasciatus]
MLIMGKLTVVPIHHNQELLEDCVLLINSEWPRSFSARMWSLQASDTLPTSLVLIEKDEPQNAKPTVLAHAKLSVIPSDQEAVFIESVVVDSRRRGQGLGRLLMMASEQHCFGVLKLKTIYLSTIDKQAFYSKLGYQLCNAISIFGTRTAPNNSTKKIWMKKTMEIWLQNNENHSRIDN